MFRLIRPIVAAACLLLPLAAAWAVDPSSAPAAGNGILLLRNGEMISGRIGQTGDHYDVELPDGEIHIRVAEVEAVCRDLQHCFAVKLGHVSPQSIGDQVALAEWCLRHHLLDEARCRLDAATAIDPKHPKLAVLQRRLQLAAELPRPQGSKVAPPTTFQPSGEELDRAVSGLPPRAVEYFTTHIQPLLLNHCSTAGCHGPQTANSFPLLRLPSGRTGSRRSTQRNLYAALALVDRQEPSNSPLLTAPAAAHGTAKSPIFSKHHANQYRQLVLWVYLVSSQLPELAADLDSEKGGDEPARLPAGADSARPLVRRRGSSPIEKKVAEKNSEKSLGKGPAKVVPATAFAAPTSIQPTGEVVPAVAEFPTNVVPPSELTRKTVKRGATQDEFLPKDEFDAEIFNRQQSAPRP